MATHDKETRVATLRQYLDEDIKRYLKQGIIPTENHHDTDEIINSIEKYIRQQRNTLLDRLDFYSLRQDDGETFDEFFRHVKGTPSRI